MTRSGSLYVLDDLDDDLNLQQNSCDQTSGGDSTMTYDRTLLSPVTLRRVFKAVFGKLQVLAFTIIGQRMITYCDRHFVYQHALDESVAPEQVVKVKLPRSFGTPRKIINLENFILILSAEGNLFQFDAETRTILRISNAILDDILVLENDLNELVELMVLERTADNGKKKSLKIINFPEMKSNYELMMSENCWLICQPKSSMNMYFVEGGRAEDEISDSKSLPNVVELKQITELHPMQRFKKLISRGLMDEAEQFAKQMNLSLEMIHEHRVHGFVIKIANERNTEELRRTFKQFMELLASMTNIQFLVNLRRIDLPDRGLKEKFLRFLMQRLKQKESSVKVEGEWEVLGEIEEQLLRLDTLKIIDPYSVEWQNFTDELNLLKCCLQMLKTNVQDACLVWSRHSGSIIPYIERQDLMKVLASIPKATELIEILHWLRHITPGLIQVQSQFMAMAVKWCMQKATALESSSLWPANSLQFMRNVHSIFSSRELIITDSDLLYKSNMERLSQMLSVLQELAELKSEFNLTLKLDNYSDQDLDKTVLNLLQRVQINHLRKLLTDFITPLFLKHNQSANSAMAQYIQFLVENRKFTSQWQEKAVIVIEMLTNEDERLQSALLVLNIAPVPWIDELKPLIEYGKSSHPLAPDIVAKHQLQVLKMIRIRYDYPANDNGNNMQLVYRIVKLGKDDMVKEIRSIVKVVPGLGKRIYMHCIAHLIQHDQLEAAITFFDDFNARPEEVGVLFTLFSNTFEHATELYMQKAIQFLNIISSRSLSQEVRRTIEDLNTIFKLRSCYGIKLACSADLLRKKRDILTKGIEYILEELQRKLSCEDILEETFNDLVILCQLLRIDCVEGVIGLCQSVNVPAFTFAITSLLVEWDVSPVGKSNYELYIKLGVLILAQVIESLSSNSSQEIPMYPLAYEILCSCVSVAKLDVIELHNLLSLIRIGKNTYQCVNSSRWFVANKRTLMDGLVKVLALAPKDASRRESTRKSRRESYSVFNETLTGITATVDAPPGGGMNGVNTTTVDLVTNCLSIMIEIMVLKEESIMSQRFRKYFAEDFNDMDFDMLSKGFIQAVNQLYQNKMLEEMHLLFHEMLTMQQRLGVTIITEQYTLAVTKKLLCAMMAKDDVDIQGE